NVAVKSIVNSIQVGKSRDILMDTALDLVSQVWKLDRQLLCLCREWAISRDVFLMDSSRSDNLIVRNDLWVKVSGICKQHSNLKDF
ncbi:hypothetical protein CEXT_193551, partial [Caerostris extrusa]